MVGVLYCHHQKQSWTHLRCGQILSSGRVASEWKLIWNFMAFTFLLVLNVDCLCSILPRTSVENTQWDYCLTNGMLQKLLYTFYKKTVKLVSLKYTFKYAGIFIVGKLNSKFIPEYRKWLSQSREFVFVLVKTVSNKQNRNAVRG